MRFSQLVDKVNKLADTEKGCKTRNRGCKKGSLLSVNDRILQPMVTQEAKISPDFILSEKIFAFAAFVRGLRKPPCAVFFHRLTEGRFF